MNPWMTWLREITGDVSDREIARRIDVSSSTISRWMHTTPRAEAVVAVARAFNAPVIDALIAAGYIERHEARTPRVIRNLARFSSVELLRELSDRVGPGGHTIAPEVIASPDDYGQEPTPDDDDLAAGRLDGRSDRRSSR